MDWEARWGLVTLLMVRGASLPSHTFGMAEGGDNGWGGGGHPWYCFCADSRNPDISHIGMRGGVSGSLMPDKF